VAVASLATAAFASAGAPMQEAAMASVRPGGGHHSKVRFGNSVVRMVQEGIIDARKIEAVYAGRGGVPAELEELLRRPSHRRIVLTRENAGLLVNLLWPLGLANRMAANSESPLNGPMLSRFASTGGWSLGKEPNGGVYFNRFTIVALTARQQALVTRVARNSFRPCCNNSTFFQDCNHGSALLGLLALGASQGLNETMLYREALAFNSFWFPEHYAHTALYFKAVRNTEWRRVDPRLVMSADFSSGSGWRANVAGELQRLGLLPKPAGPGCDV
jgi:hypothetical protein